MSKYNPEWYKKNREKILARRKELNKDYWNRPEVIELEKIRNQSPERKEYRKRYKKTEAGKIAEKRYQRSDKYKIKHKEYRLKSEYGITAKEYWEMVDNQGGVCAICKTSSGKLLHVDHSHTLGLVRGLLCGKCNRGIGMFGDSIELLKSAIEYLSRK